MDELHKELSTEIIFESTDNLVLEDHLCQTEPLFSDEEEDAQVPLAKAESITENENTYLEIAKLKSNNYKKVPIKKKESLLPFNIILESEELRSIIENLYFEIDNETRCQVMERIVQMVVEDEIDNETMSNLASYLSSILSEQINSDIFPIDDSNDEAFMDSISTPLFVMFRNQFQLCKEEDNRKKLLARVIAEMQIIQPKIGYLLLYFLKVWGKEEEKREVELCNILNEMKASVYKDFCSQREEKLDVCLIFDLQRCHEDNIAMLCYLLPEVYIEFPNVALGNVQLLHLVVSTIDSLQLQDLICQILQGHLKMLKKDSFFSLLSASLNWETFEQYCLWQLIFAHDLPIENILSILPKLQFRDHAEALTCILLMLKKEKPTQELLKQLLARQSIDGDLFVVAALRYWCREYEGQLGELLATFLCTKYPATSPNKRKRSNTKNNQSYSFPTGEQVLGHLDQLRQHCTSTSELQLYQLEGMQKALQQAQAASSDSLRKSYGDLFALAEVSEEQEPPQSHSVTSKRQVQSSLNTLSNKGGCRKAVSNMKDRALLKRAPPKERNTESSDQSSEDEEVVKPKQAKRRKKINAVGSDSD